MGNSDESYLDNLLKSAESAVEGQKDAAIHMDAERFQNEESELPDISIEEESMNTEDFSLDQDFNFDELGNFDTDMDLNLDTDLNIGDWDMDTAEELKEAEIGQEEIPVEEDQADFEEEILEKILEEEQEEAVLDESGISEQEPYDLEESLEGTSLEADLVTEPEKEENLEPEEDLESEQDSISEAFHLDDIAAMEESPEEEIITDPIGEKPGMDEAEEEDSLDGMDDLLGFLSDDTEMEMDQAASEPDEDFSEEEEKQEEGDIFSLDSMLSGIEEEQSEEPDAFPAEPDQNKDEELMDFISDSMPEEEEKEEETKEKKKGFFQRIFGNIFDEKSKAKAEQEAKEAVEKKEAAAKAKEDAVIAKEEKAKEKEEKKKAQEARKAELKAEKEAKKREKEEKKKAEAMEEVAVVDEGRINRAGAIVVTVFFAILAVFILFGTNRFSYAESVKNAKNYFAAREYTQAYNEISGVKVKSKDYELYDQINTVMYVYKQVNSYNNYYNLKMYPEALDSLLKGYKRYDRHISTAKTLGIESDLNYVREQISEELDSTFGLSEEEAYTIINIENREAYSEKVVEVAKKI